MLDGEMKELKEHARKATDALAARHREISTLEMKVDQIKMQQSDQLEAADLENVILPIKTAASTGKRRRGQDAPTSGGCLPSSPHPWKRHLMTPEASDEHRGPHALCSA